MICGQDFLVLGEEWGFYPSSTEHLLRRLVPQNRFLWVHAMGCRAPEWNGYTARRALQKLARWSTPQPARTLADGPAVCSPPVVPLHPSAPVRWWNRRALTRGIARRMRALQMGDPIFITSSPMGGELIDALHSKLNIYFIVDNYAEMPHWYGDYVRELEEKLLERAGLVFATSQPLAERKSKPGRPALLLPQGVDFEHFHRGGLEPADLAGIPRPRLLFMGLLAPWVDVDLLASVARARQDASLVLLGPVRTATEPLRGLRNVYTLGQRSYEDLPGYLAHCDLGLIPFRQNALTRYVNPLKLLEYLAAGLPVVSTALPHLALFDGAIRCAATAEEFVGHVDRVLNAGSQADRDRCIHVARENSWERRADVFSAAVERALGLAPVTA